MTTTDAPNFTRRNYGRGHAYYLDGRKLDGVTSIISNGLPKPALVKWAAKSAAELAINEWDTLAELPVSERLNRIAKGPDIARDTAAVKGTRVHALADKLARGEEVEVPEELAGHVESCVRFLDEHQVQTVLTETAVCNDTYLYGGTFDLLGLMGSRIDPTLIDWKTNKSGPFGDAAFQLAGYKYARWMAGPDGTIKPMPRVGDCAVVWLRSDGYDVYPYHVDDMVFRQFLYIQQVAKAAEMSRDYRGDALPAPAGVA